jgi:hypothetical protein
VQINIRVHTHTDTEIQMGHKIGFSCLQNFNQVRGEDLIVATANMHGFTTLNAITNVCNLDTDAIKYYVEQCNERNLTKIVPDFNVPLLLIPRTRGSTKLHKAPEYYITQVLNEANHEKIKRIHFTSYSFIRGKFPDSEITSILKILLNPLIHTTLEEFTFEIDSRYQKQMFELFNKVANHLYQRDLRIPVYHAKQFSWSETGEKIGNGTMHKFNW